jgi:alpha-beta hydrolase superfamily lysophospholipase
MTGTTPPDTVVLMHGTCVRALSWEHWMGRYSARGYRVIATGVPTAAPGDGLHCSPDRDVVTAVAEYYERLLTTVTVPPILVGHCFGGLVAQILLDRGFGAAAVAMNTPSTRRRGFRRRPRSPLLFVAGGLDRKVPAKSVEAAAGRRQRSGAVTGYLEYPDACHHTLRAPGWEQLADDVLDWAELHTDPDRTTRAGSWSR